MKVNVIPIQHICCNNAQKNVVVPVDITVIMMIMEEKCDEKEDEEDGKDCKDEEV